MLGTPDDTKRKYAAIDPAARSRGSTANLFSRSELPHNLQQRVPPDWFAQMHGAAGEKDAIRRAEVGCRRKGGNGRPRQMTIRFPVSDGYGGRVSIHLGHLHVHEHQIEYAIPESGKPFETVARDGDLNLGIGQVRLQKSNRVDAIVDHQYTASQFIHRGRLKSWRNTGYGAYGVLIHVLHNPLIGRFSKALIEAVNPGLL
jgi:hypothetical protein